MQHILSSTLRPSPLSTPATSSITLLFLEPYAHIENTENPEGLDICIIKDSYAVPFAAFASLRCHNVTLIDPRYYEENIEDFINSEKFDYVLVMFSPDDLAEEFFTFGEKR